MALQLAVWVVVKVRCRILPTVPISSQQIVALKATILLAHKYLTYGSCCLQRQDMVKAIACVQTRLPSWTETVRSK